FFLFGAVGIVLLGACTSVANLLLIKAAASRKQMAVQHALGASRFQLGAQVVTESLLLSGLGAAAGLLLAWGGVRAFIAIGPREIPLLADARIDGMVLAFTMATASVTAILAGILPAWRASRRDVTPILRQGGGRSPGSADRRLMNSLAVSQIALALLLLAAGILLTRSFRALLSVDPGFDPGRVLSFKLELPMATTYPTQEERDAFFATLLEQVEGLPGVGAATLTSAPPIEEESSLMNFTTPGRADDRVRQANFRIVAPDYFSLLGIPIVQGRAFTPSDNRSGPRVAIISETLARSIWGSESSLGATIQTPFAATAEVVGVAADVRTNGLDGQPGRTVYGAASQATYNFMTVLVKGRHDPRGIAPAIRAAVRTLDPDLPLYHVRTVGELMTQSVAQQRFLMLLVGSFSVLVFALAVVGTYGVVSYGVSERTGELGIRAALGATGADIKRLVLREGARLALAGILIGTVAAIALTRTLTRFIFQISALDPVTFILAPLLLGSAALIAVLVPAHRATRVDPMHALRVD
ncbi:MAG TPA: FtsX-like permease family protein, partial [Gemmatimonadales bacterium]